MELIDLVEQAVVADFLTDALLSQYNPEKHDDPDVQPEDKPYAFAVTAEDRGDYPALPGAGLKIVGVEIQIDYNMGADDERGIRADSLSKVAERAGDRLAPTTYDTDTSRAILNRLSSAQVKIFGSM